MQLQDLIQPIDSLTDEELRLRLIELRRRREVEKPKAVKAIKKAEHKESKKRVTGVEKLLADLSPEQLALLMKELDQ